MGSIPVTSGGTLFSESVASRKSISGKLQKDDAFYA
jgi:hypothetical protein